MSEIAPVWRLTPGHLLARLAQAWQVRGAQAISLRVAETVIWQWPAVAAAETHDLAAWLVVEGTAVAQLTVTGCDTPGDQACLNADAALLSHIASLDYELESLTSDLVETQDQLLTLYDLTRASRSQLSVPETLQAVATELARLVTVEATFAVLNVPPDWGRLDACHNNCFLSQEEIWRLFAQMQQANDELLLQGSEVAHLFGGRIRHLLLVPVQIQGRVQVGLGFLNKTSGNFQSPDLKLIRAIAEQVGAQIENALLLHETVQQARLQTEMKLAQEVQLQLLPQRWPQVPGLDLYACSRPARQVGGDFYDFIYSPDRPLIFNVGDVSGKGVSSALLMTMVRTIIRSAGRFMSNPTPQGLLSRANRDLYEDFSEVMMFSTVFVGQYEPVTRRLVYANAGHAPVIYCPAAGAAQLLEADGTPVGVLPESLSVDQVLPFAPGDMLVVASDGFHEARNKEGEMFGLSPLLALIEHSRDKSAQEIAAMLYETVGKYSAGREQDDDQTLIVMKGVCHDRDC